MECKLILYAISIPKPCYLQVTDEVISILYGSKSGNNREFNCPKTESIL